MLALCFASANVSFEPMTYVSLVPLSLRVPRFVIVHIATSHAKRAKGAEVAGTTLSVFRVAPASIVVIGTEEVVQQQTTGPVGSISFTGVKPRQHETKDTPQRTGLQKPFLAFRHPSVKQATASTTTPQPASRDAQEETLDANQTALGVAA